VADIGIDDAIANQGHHGQADAGAAAEGQAAAIEFDLVIGIGGRNIEIAPSVDGRSGRAFDVSAGAAVAVRVENHDDDRACAADAIGCNARSRGHDENLFGANGMNRDVLVGADDGLRPM